MVKAMLVVMEQRSLVQKEQHSLYPHSASVQPILLASTFRLALLYNGEARPNPPLAGRLPRRFPPFPWQLLAISQRFPPKFAPGNRHAEGLFPLLGSPLQARKVGVLGPQ